MLGLMDAHKLTPFVDAAWDNDIVPQLVDYIRLPAKSPHFDPEWKRHGHIEASIAQAHAWAAHACSKPRSRPWA